MIWNLYQLKQEEEPDKMMEQGWEYFSLHDDAYKMGLKVKVWGDVTLHVEGTWLLKQVEEHWQSPSGSFVSELQQENILWILLISKTWL